MADSSCVTNESNCVPSKSLTNKTSELTTIKSQYLFFDGLTYRWKGDLTELKRFFEIDLKLHGTWSSPGGEAKVFKSHDDLNVKWHGRKSQKIVIVKDNNEQLSRSFQKYAHNASTLDEVDNSDKNYSDSNDQANGIQSTVYDASDRTDACVQTGNNSFTDLNLRIQNIENKLLNKVNFVMDELLELKNQAINNVYEQRINMLEERNRKLERENETLNDKFIASSCIISDLNTKIKDLENDKMSLMTAIKLIQVHDDQYVDSCTSNKSTQISDNPASNEPLNSIQNVCKANTENVNEQRGLKRKYKSKKRQTEESVSKQNNSTVSNPDTLPVNNRFSILNDVDDQEDSLVTNNGKPHGNESNQIKKSNVQTDHNTADEIQDNAQINAVDDGASEQVSPNTPSSKHRVTAKPCVVMVGDSMIKHVDPKKLSKKKVYKYTYPGETAESISAKMSTLNAQIQPSHVIIHVGTNNIPIDSTEDCALKISNLATNLKEKFPHAKIAISGIIQRQDIQAAGKIEEVNKILKQNCLSNSMSFIDNLSIDSSCLNGSGIHLSAKGTAILATKFIKFLRGDEHSMSSSRNEDFHISALHQLLGNFLRSMTTSPVPRHRREKR